MRRLPIATLLLLCGCGPDRQQPQPQPQVTPSLAAPVWEAAAQVAEAGPGYAFGRIGFQPGGAHGLAVDAAGNAYLASAYAAPASTSRSRTEAWGNSYNAGQGWGTAVRLSAETGVVNDWPRGLGLTPDGALFGWAPTYGGGLRGFDLLRGWQPPGTVLSTTGSSTVSDMTTDSHGTPALLYVEDGRTWLVRHTGTLQPREVVFERALSGGALTADGSGALAVTTYGGGLAVRLPDGRWVRSVLPARAQSVVTYTSLAERPGGGFVAVWIENVQDLLTYAAADVDAAGNPGPRSVLGSALAPHVTSPIGRDYEPEPRVVAGAGGHAAVAWRSDTQLYCARQEATAWEAARSVPGAAPFGNPARMGGRLPFALALDGAGTLLAVWTETGGLFSAQQAPDQAWSTTAAVAASAFDPVLAMNADGIAFAAWREGEKVMAARSPRR